MHLITCRIEEHSTLIRYDKHSSISDGIMGIIFCIILWKSLLLVLLRITWSRWSQIETGSYEEIRSIIHDLALSIPPYFEIWCPLIWVGCPSVSVEENGLCLEKTCVWAFAPRPGLPQYLLKYSKIPILRPLLELSKSGLKDHFWTVPKVVFNQR